MAFSPPPKILQKALKFKAISHNEGKLFLFGVPGIINQLYVFVYLHRLLEQNYSQKEAARIIYSLGYLQGQKGAEIINKRFGYAETIKDKANLLKFNMGQTDLVGLGKHEWTRIDFKNEIFIAQGKSAIAEEYKRFFGVQHHAVDYFMQGEADGILETILGKPMFCVEKKCIAMGNPYCIWVSKPIDKWDKKDKEFKQQYFEKSLSMKDLGAKIDPYLITGK